jgi:hypothetical protein
MNGAVNIQTNNIKQNKKEKTHNLVKSDFLYKSLNILLDQMAVGKMIFDQETQHQKFLTQAAVTI